MTVTTNISSISFLGDGVTSVRTVPFVPGSSTGSNIVVSLSTGSTTPQIVASNLYTLSIGAPATGALWPTSFTITYPTAGPPISAGTTLTVARILPFTQTTAFSNQGNLWPSTVEMSDDTLEMQIQQLVARTTQFRGIWVTGIVYTVGDIVQDGVNGASTGSYYICAIANTSGTWATDLANGDWTVSVLAQVPSANVILGGAVSGTGPLGTSILTSINAGAVSTSTQIAAGIITNAKLASAATLTLKSNITGGSAAPSDNTLTAVIDACLGSVQGEILYRAASSWGVLSPGGAGATLNTGGAAANPSWNAANVYQGTLTNPTGTASTVGVMMGLAGTITPATSGDVNVTICGVIGNNVSSGGGQVEIRYGSGSPSSNGQALTGTGISGFLIESFATASQNIPYSVTGILQGGVAGTPYWLDAAVANNGTGTATISRTTLSAFEIK